MVAAFEAVHHQQYGFIAPEKRHIIESVIVEVIGGTAEVVDPEVEIATAMGAPETLAEVETFMAGASRSTGIYDRERLQREN